MPRQIYLDYNSTTPVDPIILQSMSKYFTHDYGNASSITHSFGKNAKRSYNEAKKVIADGLNCESDEIIITSGATESINLAIKGIVESSNVLNKNILTLRTEHKAVLDTCHYVKRFGVEVEYLDVDEDGYVDIEELNSAISKNTILVIILHGNNEIGTINPIEQIGLICKDKQVPLFVDAAQTFGKLPIDVKSGSISMLAGSAHKIYGPKGVGFLYKDKSIRLEPLIHGGGQEIGLRSGTINVSGVVGLAEAFKLIQHQRDIETKKINEMTTLFIDCLENYGIIFTLNGPKKNRLVGNLNLSLNNVDAAWLTTMLPNIAVARGSACTSETIQPSHVLRAIGLSDDKADCAIRVSFGRFTTKDEVIEAAKAISLKAKEYLSKRESIAI